MKETVVPGGGGPHSEQPILVRKGGVVQVTKTVLDRDKDYWEQDVDEFHSER